MAMLTALFLLQLVAWADSVQPSYDGFAAGLPQEPMDKLTSLFYDTYPNALPCFTTANVFNNTFSAAGCLPPLNAPRNLVFPIDLAEAQIMNNECNTLPSGQWSALASALGVAARYYSGGAGDANDNEGIVLVLVDAPSGGRGLHGSDANYNVSCMLDQVLTNADARVRGIVAADFLSDTRPSWTLGTSASGAQAAFSAADGNGLLWTSHSLNIFLFRTQQPTDTSGTIAGQWSALARRSWYNRQRFYASTHVYPMYLLQAEMDMNMLATPPPTDSMNCLSQSPMTCEPIGGVSVWATTESNVQWAWSNATSSFARRTTLGSIAIVIGATSTSLIHDAVPAADGVASGLVSALLVAKAVAESLKTSLHDVSYTGGQIHFFFSAGDNYGYSGTGRFIKEVLEIKCEEFSPSDSASACAFPYYRSLNFTTLNFDAFDHFIHLEQTGDSSEPIYYHVDERVAASPAQSQVNAALNSFGVYRADSTRLLPSPLVPIFAAAFSNDSVRDSKSFTTIARYNTNYVNTRVLSTNDTAQALSLAAVVETANFTVRLISELLFPGKPAPVIDVSDAAQVLWACFTDDVSVCSNSSDAPTLPNYYPSVFNFYANVLPTQAAIFSMFETVFGMSAFYQHAFSSQLDYGRAPTYFVPDTTSDVAKQLDPSVWVESYWGNNIGVRTTARDSKSSEWGIVATGTVVAFCCAALTFVATVRGRSLM